MKLRHLSPLAVAACTAAALLLTPQAAPAATAVHSSGDAITTGPDTAIGSSDPDTDTDTASPAVTADAKGSPLGTPSLHRLPITGSVGDLAVVGGNIWISTANQVDVYSTAGKQLAEFPGVLGAAGIIASTDQSKVYVAAAQDSKIITYDATALTQTTSWTTSPCPTDLAITAGRLFYSFGCQIPQASIGSVSVSDGTEGPVIAQNMYQPARLAGAGQTLISVSQGGFPNDVTSYLIATDGTATTQGTMRTGEGYDLAVSPDGSKLIVTGFDAGYTIERFNTADLAVAGTFAMGAYPQAVAYSPDGSGFTGALTLGQGEMIRVFDDTSGSLISHSAVDSSSTNPTVVAGTLHYSADGSRVYGVTTLNGTTSLFAATTGPVTESALTATVSNPTSYGKSLLVRISTPNRPKTQVVVVIPALGSSSTRQLTATTNADGTAVVKVAAQLSGKATISVAGDLTRTSRTVTKTIRVPAKLSIKPTGYYSTSGGIRHYHSVKAVHLVTRALPKRMMTLKVTLQARINGRWTSRVSDTFNTAADGTGYVYLTKGNKHLRYRLVLSFAGDPDNSKAPSVTSATVIVD